MDEINKDPLENGFPKTYQECLEINLENVPPQKLEHFWSYMNRLHEKAEEMKFIKRHIE